MVVIHLYEYGMIKEMNEPLNKDVKSFYGKPLKHHTPKFRGVMREVKEKRSKDDEFCYRTYGKYPCDDRERTEMLKAKVDKTKGFCK